jgi:hypothetical protein
MPIWKLTGHLLVKSQGCCLGLEIQANQGRNACDDGLVKCVKLFTSEAFRTQTQMRTPVDGADHSPVSHPQYWL